MPEVKIEQVLKNVISRLKEPVTKAERNVLSLVEAELVWLAGERADCLYFFREEDVRAARAALSVTKGEAVEEQLMCNIWILATGRMAITNPGNLTSQVKQAAEVLLANAAGNFTSGANLRLEIRLFRDLPEGKKQEEGSE